MEMLLSALRDYVWNLNSAACSLTVDEVVQNNKASKHWFQLSITASERKDSFHIEKQWIGFHLLASKFQIVTSAGYTEPSLTKEMWLQEFPKWKDEMSRIS